MRKILIVNIIVIYMNELTDINMQNPPYVLEDGHPSAAAWDIAVPLPAEKLSL